MSEGAPALRATHRLEDPFNYLQSLVSWFTSQPPPSPVSCLISCRLYLLYLSTIALGSLGVSYQEQGAADWEALGKQRGVVSLAETFVLNGIFISFLYIYIYFFFRIFHAVCLPVNNTDAEQEGFELFSFSVSRLSIDLVTKNKGSSVSGAETEASG